MTALVGYTGFVGSNIYAGANKSAGSGIDAVYNSGNIEEAFGTNPDILIYSGLRAEKYLANSAPEKDMELILEAEDNISKINPKKLVLISTIDVFKNPVNVNENSDIDTENLHPYGYNRYKLEQWVREKFQDALIIRLPGLFGQNIKKNFIYDYINVIPFMLKENKFKELSAKDPELADYYELLDNGFYRLLPFTMPKKPGEGKIEQNDETDNDKSSADKKEILKSKFRNLGFSALNFTDSRSVYQFYNLERLWDDIQTALANGITLWHPATEPVSAAEVYRYLTGKEFVNEITQTPAFYDYRTIHGDVFGGNSEYICSKDEILMQIKEFVNTRN